MVSAKAFENIGHTPQTSTKLNGFVTMPVHPRFVVWGMSQGIRSPIVICVFKSLHCRLAFGSAIIVVVFFAFDASSVRQNGRIPDGVVQDGLGCLAKKTILVKMGSGFLKDLLHVFLE